jgi:2'-5' RNA ligase
MKLAVVAFPQLAVADRDWIESYRAAHDPQANRIAAHFTLVFPTDASVDVVTPEIAMAARSMAPFAFVTRRTKVVADGTQSHVFLVPDEGAAEIVALHNRLYSGVLRPYLRTDIPFVPHITIGVAPNSAAAVKLAQQIDSEATVLRGTIDALELLNVTGARIQSVATYKFG